jgi:hypothetical protein
MARTSRNQAHKRHLRSHAHARKATVVHDGSAFQLSTDLRRYGFQVDEGPLFSSFPDHESGHLAVIASRPGAAKSERLREWARQLCGSGAAVVAIGAAVGSVAELFGSPPSATVEQPVSGRLADIRSVGEGLFAGLPEEFRLALPAGDRFETEALSAEFSTTAWSIDGELIGASHVFRPVHLLHPATLESRPIRSAVLQNMLRLLRERGGRAF